MTKSKTYYKVEGVKALFTGPDNKFYLNDGNGNMIPYDDTLEDMIKKVEEVRELYRLKNEVLLEIYDPEPTTNSSNNSEDNLIKLDYSHVNNASLREVTTRIETREPVKLSHLTRAGKELFKDCGKNSFVHAVFRGNKFVWVWTGDNYIEE